MLLHSQLLNFHCGYTQYYIRNYEVHRNVLTGIIFKCNIWKRNDQRGIGAWVPNLSIIVTLGWIIVIGDCPVLCMMFTIIHP